MPAKTAARLPQTLAAGLRRHRAALVLLALALLGLCLFWAARGSRAWMDAWLRNVSMPFKRAVSAAVDPLPFSACEAAATLAVLAAVVLLVRAVVLAVRGVRNRLDTWLLHFAALAAWIYLLVCAFWGTQYYGATFAEQAGMEIGDTIIAINGRPVKEISWEEQRKGLGLKGTTRYTVRKANGKTVTYELFVQKPII